MLKSLLSLALVLAMSCATTKETDWQKEPPPWLPVTAFCVGCAAIPTIAVLAPLLLGPNEKVPGYGTRMEGSPYRGEDVAKLLDTFIEVWEGKFHNANLARPFVDRLDILWIESDKWDDGVPYMIDHNRHVAGTMDWVGRDALVRRGRMRITWGTGFRLHQGALSHELAHGFLFMTTGEADRDHLAKKEGQTWTPDVEWVIAETNRRVALLGD